MTDSTGLFLAVFFGSVGLGYFVYGKRQNRFVPIVAGVILCVYPYLVSNLYAMVAIGVVLIALPFFVRV